jgi:hypothetical protein
LPSPKKYLVSPALKKDYASELDSKVCSGKKIPLKSETASPKSKFLVLNFSK